MTGPGSMSGPGWFAQPLLLLATGTTVALTAQHINTMSSIDAAAQLLVLMRYAFTFAHSGWLARREARRMHAAPAARARQPAAAPLPARLRLLLLIMGLVDLFSYTIFNLGFAAAGAAVATVVLAAAGQIFTAIASVTLLRRRLTARHVAAVATVTLGLLLRSLDDLPAAHKGDACSSTTDGSSGGALRQQLYGAGCVVLSALLFSVLGCLYEQLMSRDTQQAATRVSQAQASLAITGVSLAATLAHQALFTLPNWQRLVSQPLAAAPHSAAAIAAAHAAYGLVTAAHSFVQVRLLATHGALTVGLVNAVRASVVSVGSSWLFCSAAASHLCLTPWRAASAAVVTAGAALWVLAGKPQCAPLAQPARAKKLP